MTRRMSFPALGVLVGMVLLFFVRCGFSSNPNELLGCDNDKFPIATNLSGSILAAPTFSVFRSTDNADSWTNVSSGLPQAAIWSLLLTPAGNAFAGAAGVLSRRTLGSDSWEIVLDSIANVLALCVDSSGYLYASTEGAGFFRSTDNGTTWTKLIEGYQAQFWAIAARYDGQLFAGPPISRSTDHGETWAVANAGIENLGTQTLAINAQGAVFVGTYGGVYRSTNEGNNWTSINQGLANLSVSSLAINRLGHVFAATTGGVFRSMNRGEAWVAVNNGLSDLSVRSIAVSVEDLLLASTLNHGVYNSANGGDTWVPANNGLKYCRD